MNDIPLRDYVDRLLAEMDKHYGSLEQARKLLDERREEDDQRFKRLESFQARMIGGMVVLCAIGIGNLVKLWLG